MQHATSRTVNFDGCLILLKLLARAILRTAGVSMAQRAAVFFKHVKLHASYKLRVNFRFVSVATGCKQNRIIYFFKLAV